MYGELQVRLMKIKITPPGKTWHVAEKRLWTVSYRLIMENEQGWHTVSQNDGHDLFTTEDQANRFAESLKELSGRLSSAQQIWPLR